MGKATSIEALSVVTTHQVEGRKVAEYLGIVSGEAVLGFNFFKDFAAAVRDVVGGRVSRYEEAFRGAARTAIDAMEDPGKGARGRRYYRRRSGLRFDGPERQPDHSGRHRDSGAAGVTAEDHPKEGARVKRLVLLLTGLSLFPAEVFAYNWDYPMFSSAVQPIADTMYTAVADTITSPLVTIGLAFAAAWSVATMWRNRSGANPIADVTRALVAVVCISSGQFLFNEINFIAHGITMLPQQNLIDAGMSPFIGLLPYQASTEANAKRVLGSKGVEKAEKAREQGQMAYLETFAVLGGVDYEKSLDRLRREQAEPGLWETLKSLPEILAGAVMTPFAETIAAVFGGIAALISLLLLMYRTAALGLLYVLFPLAAALFVFPWRPLQMVLPNVILNYFVLRLWDFAFAVVLAFWTPMMIAVADKMAVMGGIQLALMSLILPIIMLTIPRLMASLFAAGLGTAVSGMAASTVMFYGVMMRMMPGGGGSLSRAPAPVGGGGRSASSTPTRFAASTPSP